MIITKDIISHILTNVNQEEVVAYVLGITIKEVEEAIENRYNIINTLRGNDTNPSLRLSYYNNKLKMWDYGDILYRGDIFDLVGIFLNKNTNNGKEFIDICEFILKVAKTKPRPIVNNTERQTKVITYTLKRFNSIEVDYWEKGNVSKQHLINRGVQPVDKFYINNNYIASSSNDDPIFVYLEGWDKIEIVKVYRPFADKKYKFITNNKFLIEGYNDLYPSDILIITKSKKDRLVLESILDKGTIARQVNNNIIKSGMPPYSMYPYFLGLYNKSNAIDSSYCVTNLTNEGVLLSDKTIRLFRKNHNTIIINFDYDLTGVVNSFIYNKLYNIIPVFLGRDRQLVLDNLTDKTIRLILNKFKQLNIDATIDDLIYYIKLYEGDFKEKDVYDFISTNNDKHTINGKFNEFKEKQ